MRISVLNTGSCPLLVKPRYVELNRHSRLWGSSRSQQHSSRVRKHLNPGFRAGQSSYNFPVTRERWAQIGITTQFVIVVRTLGEIFRLKHVQGTKFSAAVAMPVVRNNSIGRSARQQYTDVKTVTIKK
jgi:hypothetical protein